jgi:hypothetical protein
LRRPHSHSGLSIVLCRWRCSKSWVALLNCARLLRANRF